VAHPPLAGRRPARSPAPVVGGDRAGADYDLIVIGGGAAGLSAARTAARRRARVALVQAGPVGGDCTFFGCVPSKTLIEAAARGADFATAMARVRSTVARIAATETAAVLRAEGVHVVEGWARLEAADRVAVGDRRLRSRRLVIATGSGPIVPAIPGLGGVDVLTNENVFQLTESPGSLAVVGGGPVGAELAQAFARLGTTVTLVEQADRLLAREEPEASAVVAAALAADGVDIRCARRVTSVAGVETGVRLRFDDGDGLEAERILVAVGRRPVTDGLGLDAAGVATDAQGFIRTDDRLRTNVGGIWAAGDIVGRSQHTHAADAMGRTAAANALSRVEVRRYRDAWMPAVTFTAPELARVGLTEHQAARPGVRVAYLPMAEVDRAVTAGRTDGYVKLIVGPRPGTRNLAGGRLLGATIVAERAGEMIALPTLAIRAHMFPARLALATQAYPTWSLAVQQAAAQLFFPTGGRVARPAVS
jgi:pyruvate/2-oxoglutarate dehydrogenase complex dihydrolipoamide dehydrogenase (E3) component